jgi:hypothetical protein
MDGPTPAVIYRWNEAETGLRILESKSLFLVDPGLQPSRVRLPAVSYVGTSAAVA